jgi:hypothetical protein
MNYDVHDIARRIAMWDARGWLSFTLDITDGFAEWRNTRGEWFSARLQPDENYVRLPLHCRDLDADSTYQDADIEVLDCHIEAARWRIQDMAEFVTA